MKEFIQSLFETSNERIKNPFIGSYIVAFIVFNWRPFLFIVLSDSRIEDKIVVINHEYCKKEALFWPLAIALFYTLILPYINLLFDYLLSFSNQRKENRKNENILNNLKQKKAEAKFEREIADERAGTSEISNLKQQIDLLKEQNDDLLKKSNTDLQSFNAQTAKWNDSQAASMIVIENLRKEVKNYKDSYERLINNPAVMTLPKESIKIIDNFTHDEQLQISKLNIDKIQNENSDLIIKAMKNGILYESNTGKIQLTQFGKIVIKYINDTIPPF
jgi:hypothetical protein